MVTGQLKSVRITLEAIEGGVLGYIYLRDIKPGKVDRTDEIESGSIMADYDSNDQLIGVEFLHAENADSTLMHNLAEKLNAPELAGINLSEMCKSKTH